RVEDRHGDPATVVVRVRLEEGRNPGLVLGHQLGERKRFPAGALGTGRGVRGSGGRRRRRRLSRSVFRRMRRSVGGGGGRRKGGRDEEGGGTEGQCAYEFPAGRGWGRARASSPGRKGCQDTGRGGGSQRRQRAGGPVRRAFGTDTRRPAASNIST